MLISTTCTQFLYWEICVFRDVWIYIHCNRISPIERDFKVWKNSTHINIWSYSLSIQWKKKDWKGLVRWTDGDFWPSHSLSNLSLQTRLSLIYCSWKPLIRNPPEEKHMSWQNLNFLRYFCFLKKKHHFNYMKYLLVRRQKIIEILKIIDSTSEEERPET